MYNLAQVKEFLEVYGEFKKAEKEYRDNSYIDSMTALFKKHQGEVLIRTTIPEIRKKIPKEFSEIHQEVEDLERLIIREDQEFIRRYYKKEEAISRS